MERSRVVRWGDIQFKKSIRPLEMPSKQVDIQAKEKTIIEESLKSNRKTWAKAGDRDGEGEVSGSSQDSTHSHWMGDTP